MIIPPDDEKDPRLFSSSTPSLVTPLDSATELTHPPAAHVINHPYGFLIQDRGSYEYLPPYEQRRSLLNTQQNDQEITRRQPPPLVIGHRSGSISDNDTTPTASSSRLPIINTPSTVVATDSRAKLWESSASTSSSKGKRVLGIPRKYLSTSPRVSKWWKKWKKWIYAVLVIFFIGIGVMIGMVIGWKNGLFSNNNNDPPTDSSPWSSSNGDEGRRTTQWGASSNANLNFTYIPSRDGPDPSWGVMSHCNNFIPLTNSTLNQLSTPFPSNIVSLASFTIPLYNSTDNHTLTLLNSFFVYSTGLASAGTVEFVGSDGPPDVIAGGMERNILVDVAVRYAGPQEISSFMQVCQMSRPDGGQGVAVLTPIQTDGKINSVYQLDPTQLPQYQVTVRFPPSVIYGTTPMYLPSVQFLLERMAVRFGQMNTIQFGTVNITQGRGGVSAGYVSAEQVTIRAGQNAVIGKWNISESIKCNVTSGSILADVILSTPNTTTPHISNSTNTTYTTNYTSLVSRGPHPQFKNISDVLHLALVNVSTTTTINTSFATTEGYVRIRYLQQSPRVAVSSFITTGQGAIDISLTSNFTGPFAIKNAWGEIRIPPPMLDAWSDPQNWGRQRMVSTGLINVSNTSDFTSIGLNSTYIVNSGTTVTGAAYWMDPAVGPVSPESIQSGAEGVGNELIVLGAWGDITLTVDGS